MNKKDKFATMLWMYKSGILNTVPSVIGMFANVGPVCSSIKLQAQQHIQIKLKC